MLNKILLFVVFTAFSFATFDALAKPPWARDDRGNYEDRDEGKWKHKHHKKHKHWRGRSVRFSGGPPPWAPAHGYRRKNRGSRHYVIRGRYATPYGINLGTCNRDKIGMVIGGVAGAALGSRVGKGDGRLAATIVGTVAGVVIGGYVGRNLDRADETCIGQALEHAPTGRVVRWTNPDTGARYEVTPRETFRQGDGRYCREYTAGATVGGRGETVTGVACRQADGTWRIQS